MQIYELGYLILPSIPEDGLPDVVNKIKSAIEKAGGKEVAGENPFKSELAYEMTKTIGASRYVVKEAYVGWVKFELEPAEALSLKASLEKIDEILRSLIIKVPREANFTFAEARAKLKEKEVLSSEKSSLEESEAKEMVVE